MENINYIDVNYGSLNNWLNTNVNESKDYNINITGNIPINDLKGDWGPSKFGKLFSNRTTGAKFNIKFKIPENVGSLVFCLFGIESIKTLDLSGYSPNVITAEYLCSSCTNLEMVKINSGDIVDASHMFEGCSNLKSVDLCYTKNITDSSYMFADCTNLTNIENMSFLKSENSSYMFTNCKSLKTVDASTFINSRNSQDMFADCTNLEFINGIDGTGGLGLISSSDGAYMFSRCESLTNEDFKSMKNLVRAPGLLFGCSKIKKADIGNSNNLLDLDYAFKNCSELEAVSFPNVNEDLILRDAFVGCDNIETLNFKTEEDMTKANRYIPPEQSRGMKMEIEQKNKYEIEEFKYADVPFNELSEWINTHSTIETPIEYSVNVTGTIPPEKLAGPEHMAAEIGVLFQNVPSNIKYNLKINIPESAYDISRMFFNIQCLKSIKLTGGKNCYKANESFTGCRGLTLIDLKDIEKINDMFYFAQTNNESLTVIMPKNIYQINCAQDLFGRKSEGSRTDLRTMYVCSERDKYYLLSNNMWGGGFDKYITSEEIKVAPELYEDNYVTFYDYMNVRKDSDLKDLEEISASNSLKLGGIPANEYATKVDLKREKQKTFRKGDIIFVDPIEDYQIYKDDDDSLPKLGKGLKWKKIEDIILR